MRKLFNKHPEWFQEFINAGRNNEEAHCTGVKNARVFYNKSHFNDGVPVLKVFDRANEYVYHGYKCIEKIEVDIPEGTPCVYDSMYDQVYIQYDEGWIWNDSLEKYIDIPHYYG